MARFVLLTDPHVTVPNPSTGWEPPPIPEPTLYRHSVELLEAAIDEINALPSIDFVLVAGDMTKDSEPYNHDRARELLTRLRRPTYCIPGNHDQPRPEALRPLDYLDGDVELVRLREIPRLYGDFGFDDSGRLAYSADPAPDVHLVALCSPKPDSDHGEISDAVLAWLEEDLREARHAGREVVLMLHHSIVDHVPGEATSPMFSWFHVINAPALKQVLRRHGVRLTLSGHLHMQDIKEEDGLYNIVTSSIASFPHAYRVLDLHDGRLEVRSRRLQAIPSMPRLQEQSRAFATDVFEEVVCDALRGQPFKLDEAHAARAAVRLRDWWPRMAEGDEQFAYTAEELESPALAAFVNAFSDRPPADNDVVIELGEKLPR